MTAENVELLAELSHRATVVPDVGVPGDQPQEHPLTTAPDQDGWVRPLHRLRIADGLAKAVVASLERGTLLGPEELLHAERLVELAQALADGREVVAVALVLTLVPAGTHAVDEPAPGEHVDRRRHLCDQGR